LDFLSAHDALLEDVDAIGTKLVGSRLSGATLRRRDLRDADLGHYDPEKLRTELVGTRFEQCDLRGAKIPDDLEATFVEGRR
jgi:uncharacterized protein YjbI with pentapeptide repeats